MVWHDRFCFFGVAASFPYRCLGAYVPVRTTLPLPPPHLFAELWPSLVRQKIGYDKWTVVHLGPVVRQTRGCSSPTEPVFSVEEVMPSSLLQFPGGVPLMALKEKLKRPPKSTEKKAKRAHVRDEFSLPANKERQVQQRITMTDVFVIP